MHRLSKLYDKQWSYFWFQFATVYLHQFLPQPQSILIPGQKEM